MKIQKFYSNAFNKYHFTSQKTFAVLGASTVPKEGKSKEEILKYMQIASDFTKYLVKDGNSIITGCGNSAIMGAAYYSAYENGSIEQNKVYIKEPEWGDEDKEHCTILGYVTSEAERAENFRLNSDAIYIFPGSCGTIEEASRLISSNYYSNSKKPPIILIGKDFFKGIDEQYKYLFNNGYLNNINSLDDLYLLIDNLEELKETVK